jgi:hypothetical protein
MTCRAGLFQALGAVHGLQAGIQGVREIRRLRDLKSYYLLHAVLGEYEARQDRSRSGSRKEDAPF